MPTGARAGSQAAIVADAADDLGSLRGKLEGVAAERVYLVVPREARVLRTPLEFRVLTRLAETLASEIVVISGDAERRRMAGRAGFRTRRGLRGLLHLLPPEQADRYRFRWYRVWRWFPLLPFVSTLGPPLLSVAIVLAIVALVPELRVTLVSRAQTDTALVDLAVDSTLAQPDIWSRRLPGIPLEHRFEVETAVPATGRVRRAVGYAQGQIVLVNSRNDILRVPEGLVLVGANGSRFVTQTEARLPPGSLRGTRVPIRAAEAGPSGNVAAMAITRLLDPGPPGLAAFNELPTAGGTEEDFSVVSAADFDTLRGELLSLARVASLAHLQALAGEDLSIVADTLRVEPVVEQFAPGLRVEATEVSGRMVSRATALAYSNEAFNALALAAWEATLPRGYRALERPIDISVPEYLGLEGGTALFRIGVRGRSAPEVDGVALAHHLRGASLAEAREALTEWGGLGGPVQVEMWPPFAPRALRLQLRVTRGE